MKDARHYNALDGFRGVAALAVATAHFGVSNHIYNWQIVRQGGVYVDFFFVLSGFVITHSYGQRLKTRADAADFMIRRFGRLAPLHYFMLAALILLEIAKLAIVKLTGVSGGAMPFTGESATAAIPAHLVFAQAFGLFDAYTWNGPSWSIGVEFWTYAVFAGACLLGHARQSWAALFAIAASFALLVTFPGLRDTYVLGIFRCIAYFFAGKISYEIIQPWLDCRLLTRRLANAVELALLGSLFAAITLFPLLQSAGRAVQMAVFLVLLPVFVAAFGLERGIASKVLMLSPIQTLGAWSYSIYMVHFFLHSILAATLRVSDKVFGTNFAVEVIRDHQPIFEMPLLAGDVLLVAYLVAVIGASAVTYHYVEVPGRNWFNKLARSRAARTGKPHAGTPA